MGLNSVAKPPVRRGFFMVIEGIDGSGGETQTRKTLEFLRNRGKNVLELTYPNPKSPIGALIYEYLNKKFDLPVESQTALYIADFSLDKAKIEEALASGRVVLSNRYFQSTLAYQSGAKGYPREKAIEMAKLLGIPVPDIVVYVDISSETSLKRKIGEKAKSKEKLDRHEEDKAFLEKVRGCYLGEAKDGVFAGKWVVVDGERGIDEVSKMIQEAIRPFL
jgi:dTMP kinase